MTKVSAALLSVASLVVCLAAPVLFFRGDFDELIFKQILTVASLGWFVFATIWATRR